MSRLKQIFYIEKTFVVLWKTKPMSTEKSCKNCGGKMATDFQFCPYCGQEVADDLTIGLLFSNTISNYFSVDARFFRSFIPLMFRPGVLARRFVDGKGQIGPLKRQLLEIIFAMPIGVALLKF